MRNMRSQNAPRRRHHPHLDVQTTGALTPDGWTTANLAERLQAELTDARARLMTATADLAALHQELTRTRAELDAARAERDQASTEMATARAAADDLRHERDQTHHALAALDIDDDSCTTLESTVTEVVRSWRQIAASEARAIDIRGYRPSAPARTVQPTTEDH